MSCVDVHQNCIGHAYTPSQFKAVCDQHSMWYILQEIARDSLERPADRGDKYENKSCLDEVTIHIESCNARFIRVGE
jgi:hypothetical protein